MRSLIFASLLIIACSEAADSLPADRSDVECTFQFDTKPVCTYQANKHTVKVSLITKKSADDEITLTQANVIFDGKKYTLSISPDVSMNIGDVGVVSFADINFDNIPDMAVSTSFGVANQYFDYWTYDPNDSKYHSIGNYPKLSPNTANKTLTANIKLDAATYQPQKYSWDRGRLIRQQ